MKKLYLLLVSLAAFSAAQAQTFTFNYNGKPVEGETLVCDASDAEIEDYGTDVDVTIAPNISVTADLGDNEGGITATLNIECLTGQSVQCCYGGDCSTGPSFSKTMDFEEPDKLTAELLLEYIGQGVNLESIKGMTVKITVADTFEPETYNKSLTVVMYGGDAGVSVIENNKHFQTAKGGFSYDLPGEAVVTLYNAGGVVCGQYKLNGNGFLSAEGLPAGIYFFTAVGEGVNESGKVAI